MNSLSHLDLLFFTKAPRSGEVKTRLGKDIGYEAAAALHASFVHTLARTLERFASRTSPQTRRLVLARADDTYHPLLDEEILAGARAPWSALVQSPGSLGERLICACEQLDRRAGAHHVMIIGSDSPTLDEHMLERAAQALTSHDVVIGPSFDGGYYLIGMSSPGMTQLFEQISWSSPQVLRETLARCAAHDLDVKLLEFWYDVDTLADLEFLRTHLLDYLVASPAAQHYSDLVSQIEALPMYSTLPIS